MNKFISRILILTLIASLVPVTQTQAAVTSISWSGTNLTGSSIDVSTELGDSGDSTVNFTTATALVLDGDTITITLNGAVVTTGQTLTVADLTLSDSGGGESLEASPGTGDNGAHEVVITNGASGNSNPIIEITLDNSGGPTAPNFATGAATLVIADGQLESSATPGNYNIVVVTSSELGVGMLYVGDDNDVTVTATVDPFISFLIRNSADSADTNVCALGTLSTGSVSTCDYRLAAETNASSGFQIQITSDGDLETAGSDDIDPVAEDDTVTAGDEEYGIAVTAATAGGHDGAGNFDQPATEDGDFNDDDTPIPTSATNFLSFTDTFDYTQGDTTTSTLVTHRASISGGTAAGSYEQVVTYTITGSF